MGHTLFLVKSTMPSLNCFLDCQQGARFPHTSLCWRPTLWATVSKTDVALPAQMLRNRLWRTLHVENEKLDHQVLSKYEIIHEIKDVSDFIQNKISIVVTIKIKLYLHKQHLLKSKTYPKIGFCIIFTEFLVTKSNKQIPLLIAHVQSLDSATFRQLRYIVITVL